MVAIVFYIVRSDESSFELILKGVKMKTKGSIYRECGGFRFIKTRILYALQEGMALTQADASKSPFCTSRLGAFIHCLRKEGYNIITEIVAVVCADGHIAYVGKYSLKRRKTK